MLNDLNNKIGAILWILLPLIFGIRLVFFFLNRPFIVDPDGSWVYYLSLWDVVYGGSVLNLFFHVLLFALWVIGLLCAIFAKQERLPGLAWLLLAIPTALLGLMFVNGIYLSFCICGYWTDHLSGIMINWQFPLLESPIVFLGFLFLQGLIAFRLPVRQHPFPLCYPYLGLTLYCLGVLLLHFHFSFYPYLWGHF